MVNRWRNKAYAPVCVIIIGTSGHARVIADIVSCAGDTVEGFLDDNNSSRFGNMEVIGAVSDATRLYKENPDRRFIIGIGSNVIREAIADRLGNLPYHTAIHPSAIVASACSISPGTVIMANAVVNTGSVIGCHCIINTAATVDHDCQIGDCVHLSPGVHLAGTVKIGRSSWLGIGSLASNNITICDGCTIGAGAVVIKDIDKPGIYVGVPVRKIKP